MPSPLVIEASGLLPPGDALDVACGTGRHTHYLRALGWRVTAVDIASTVPNVLLLDLERTPLPFPAESFDLVVMTLYLQRSLWPTVRKLLRPSGLLATSAKLTGRFAAHPHELRDAFSDFAVLRYREADGLAELLARKE
ncbi:MAG: class I SAM-dependent methyltransferase [Acidobacteria bacterium]|nr:class I SAM-dependent methyltransferase [Acidobacteriota bacterium]